MKTLQWAVVALALAACGSVGSPPPNTTPVASTSASTIVMATSVPETSPAMFQ
jgi:hypothetical protein